MLYKKEESLQALIDLDSTFVVSSQHSEPYKDPRLNSETGFHNGNAGDFWLEVEFPAAYYVNQMILYILKTH